MPRTPDSVRYMDLFLFPLTLSTSPHTLLEVLIFYRGGTQSEAQFLMLLYHQKEMNRPKNLCNIWIRIFVNEDLGIDTIAQEWYNREWRVGCT